MEDVKINKDIYHLLDNAIKIEYKKFLEDSKNIGKYGEELDKNGFLEFIFNNKKYKNTKNKKIHLQSKILKEVFKINVINEQCYEEIFNQMYLCRPLRVKIFKLNQYFKSYEKKITKNKIYEKEPNYKELCNDFFADLYYIFDKNFKEIIIDEYKIKHNQN